MAIQLVSGQTAPSEEANTQWNHNKQQKHQTLLEKQKAILSMSERYR